MNFSVPKITLAKQLLKCKIFFFFFLMSLQQSLLVLHIPGEAHLSVLPDTLCSISNLFHIYFNVFFPLLLTGQEYAAIVEFAPFQKAAKKKSKKKDAKTGTIEDGITAS